MKISILDTPRSGTPIGVFDLASPQDLVRAVAGIPAGHTHLHFAVWADQQDRPELVPDIGTGLFVGQPRGQCPPERAALIWDACARTKAGLELYNLPQPKFTPALLPVGCANPTPHFVTYAEAEVAGWILREPRTITYRSWYVLTTHSGYRGWIVWGREVSGRAMPGRRGGVQQTFRHVYLRRSEQPPETNIWVDECRDRTGQIARLSGATRLRDWEFARDQVMRLIDIRRDGRANLDEDLIE